DASARLPVRRDVPPRPYLPRRRPRRAGHPALPAADRRRRGVGADRGRPAPGARRGGETDAPLIVLSVRDLLRDLDVGVLVGSDESLAVPVRWVHITELIDPTPWLSGGELLLTTGLQLGDPEVQRQFVQRLADHQLAGLGFG